MATHTDVAPVRRESPAVRWAKENLFSNWYNTLFTLLFGALFVWAGFTLIRWVFWRAEWRIVEANLALFMLGRFPRDELARIWVSNYLLAGTIGLMAGATAASAAVAAEGSGPDVREIEAARVDPALLADIAADCSSASVHSHLDTDLFDYRNAGRRSGSAVCRPLSTCRDPKTRLVAGCCLVGWCVPSPFWI